MPTIAPNIDLAALVEHIQELTLHASLSPDGPAPAMMMAHAVRRLQSNGYSDVDLVGCVSALFVAPAGTVYKPWFVGSAFAIRQGGALVGCWGERSLADLARTSVRRSQADGVVAVDQITTETVAGAQAMKNIPPLAGHSPVLHAEINAWLDRACLTEATTMPTRPSPVARM